MPAAVAQQIWPNKTQTKTWYKAYCKTQSTANKAAFERAVLLGDIEGALGEKFEDFLRDPEKGFGLTPLETQKGVDLVVAFKRYPGGNHKSGLLWEAMGEQITRLQKIPNAIVRKSVRDRCYREAEELNGFISASKLTTFIKMADPNYFVAHPSQRKMAKDVLVKNNVKLQKQVNSLSNGLRRAVELLLEEGYTLEQTGITKISLKIADLS